jgi:hypothetical protein|tara:strand:+ start:1207 stop:1524 length:318 start_codon:yes stop_codon:yes gene_type:complete
MSIVVEVTKDDIRQGVRKDPCQCPIAIALRRAIKSEIEDSTGIEPDDMDVEVDFDDIRYWNHDISGDEFNLFPVDEEDWYEIKNFMENFDLGNDVKPFNVELEYN